MKCGVCGKAYRKQGTRVFVAASNEVLGGIRRVIACPTCARQCIHLALPEAAPRCECGSVATSCAPCENDRAPKVRAAIVAGAIRKMAGMLRAYPEGNAFHSGLRMAIDVLTAGDWSDEP